MRSSPKLLGALAAAMLAVPSALGSSNISLKSVGESLICQCGCNQTVTGCNHYECSSRTEMQALIQKEMDAGKNETAILQDFVLRYGVKVLSTPPASGFNLAVWILPAVSLVAGLVVLIVITKRWRKSSPEPATTARIEVDPQLRAAVEDELRTSKL